MNFLDSWWLDVKLGMRMLIKYPGLTLCGVIGIAVAVAIATGGFSAVYVNLLATSMPLDEGDRIVAIQLWDTRLHAAEPRVLHEFHSWREGLKSVQEVSAFQTLTLNLITPGAAPESVRVAAMSASGFGIARVRPLFGRVLAEEDEQTGAASVVVIGHDVWRSRFASDAGILDRTIRLGATSYRVVGVMPKGFGFPVNHDFWVPLRAETAPEPLTGPALAVFGRLAPGATLESAQAEVGAVGRRAVLLFPKVYASLQPRVEPYPASVLGLSDDMAGIVAMQGIVIALLVLVCLNVAILTYTRTVMRHAEIGVRTALGAARSRIVMQLFIEALVLSVVATSAGVAIAALALRQLTAATLDIARELPFWFSFRLAPEAVLYAGALSVLAAVIVGVVPALQATGGDLRSGLRVVGAGESGLRLGRIWTILIVAQVGFAVAVLPTAIVNVSENLSYALARPGFAADQFLAAQLGMAGTTGFDRYAIRHAELMRHLAADPRISHATFAASEPGDERRAKIEAEDAAGVIHEVRFNQVDVNFFRTFEAPVLAGRGFQSADIAPAKPGDPPTGESIVVNQPLAAELFGGNALGRRIRYVGSSASKTTEPGRWYEIVGIVSNFPGGVSAGMRDSQLKLYHAVAAGQVQPAVLAMRVRHDPAAFAQHLREMAVAIDPDLFLRNVRTLDDALRKEQWIVRMEASVVLAVTFSVVLLSSAGIYALMSFTVSQRRREIGIRMALGATGGSILAAIFSRALKQLGSGAAIGGACGVVFNRFFVGQADQASIALLAVAPIMVAVGLLAALGPTRRSLRIEPTEALRES